MVETWRWKRFDQPRWVDTTNCSNHTTQKTLNCKDNSLNTEFRSYIEATNEKKEKTKLRNAKLGFSSSNPKLQG